VEKYGRAGQATNGNIIRRMRFACWVSKATDTHSECVIHIAFPLQKWLRERSSGLRYTHICRLVPVVWRRGARCRCVDLGCKAPVCGVADQRYVRSRGMGPGSSWLPGGHSDCNWVHRSAAGESVLYPDGEAA